MKLQIKARVSKDGTGQPMLDFDKTEYRKAISELSEGSTVLISISDQRTLDQNKLLHSLLNEISAYTGDSLEDMKVYMKHMFLGYVEHEVTGYECIEEGEDCEKFPVKKKIKELRSTTTLSKKEFGDFITQIQAWAWENLGLNLNNMSE